MPKVKEFCSPMSLQLLFDSLADIPWQNRVYIANSTSKIELETLCYIVDIDEHLDDEIESYEEENALKDLFHCQTIEDIRCNLQHQLPMYSRTQLAEAIDYYWRNDAFVIVD